MKRFISQWSRERIITWLKLTIDLVFPPRCAGCDVAGTVWCCEECSDHIIAPKGRSCPACGFPLDKGMICSICEQWPNRIHARAFAHYKKPLSYAILKLNTDPIKRLLTKWHPG